MPVKVGKIEGEEGEVIKMYSNMMKKKQKQEKKLKHYFSLCSSAVFIFHFGPCQP